MLLEIGVVVNSMPLSTLSPHQFLVEVGSAFGSTVKYEPDVVVAEF